MKNTHKRWLYHRTQEAKVFEAGVEIPFGWYDSPAFDDPRTNKLFDGDDVTKKYPSQMNKDELISHGELLGLDLTGKTKKQMLQSINDFVSEAEEQSEK